MGEGLRAVSYLSEYRRSVAEISHCLAYGNSLREAQKSKMQVGGEHNEVLLGISMTNLEARITEVCQQV